jgi:hypothetical protein
LQAFYCFAFAGKLVKGKHPALVDLQTFMRANKLLDKAVNVNVAKTRLTDHLPIKIFAKEERSLSPMSGYIKKGNWYYTALGQNIGVNVSAKQLHSLFKTCWLNSNTTLLTRISCKHF